MVPVFFFLCCSASLKNENFYMKQKANHVLKLLLYFLVIRDDLFLGLINLASKHFCLFLFKHIESIKLQACPLTSLVFWKQSQQLYYS